MRAGGRWRAVAGRHASARHLRIMTSVRECMRVHVHACSVYMYMLCLCVCGK